MMGNKPRNHAIAISLIILVGCSVLWIRDPASATTKVDTTKYASMSVRELVEPSETTKNSRKPPVGTFRSITMPGEERGFELHPELGPVSVEQARALKRAYEVNLQSKFEGLPAYSDGPCQRAVETHMGWLEEKFRFVDRAPDNWGQSRDVFQYLVNTPSPETYGVVREEHLAEGEKLYINGKKRSTITVRRPTLEYGATHLGRLEERCGLGRDFWVDLYTDQNEIARQLINEWAREASSGTDDHSSVGTR